MPNDSKLGGIIPPILTPTDEHDNVDEPALRGFVDWLIDAGVNGLFVGGSAGEGPLLVERQWTRLAQIVFDQTRGRVPLMMGVQDTSTRKVLDKIHRAREIGYRYCVATPTFYNPCASRGEQLRLFGACYEAAGPMELVAYNIPQLTISAVEVDTFCELARRGWIRYCKESSGNIEFVRQLIARGADVGLEVLMGDEMNAAAGLLAGARGLVNLCINVEPSTYLKLFAAVQRQDLDEAQRMQARICELVSKVALVTPSFVAGPKYLMGRRGFGIGPPAFPARTGGARAGARNRRLHGSLAQQSTSSWRCRLDRCAERRAQRFQLPGRTELGILVRDVFGVGGHEGLARRAGIEVARLVAERLAIHPAPHQPAVGIDVHLGHAELGGRQILVLGHAAGIARFFRRPC